MDSTGLAMERRFKCCNKDFSHYLCIECMGVFHKSCAARMRHVKGLTSYKIHCSRLCEQTYEKKLKHQETIDEVMESEIKYLEDFNQQKNIIKKLHDEIKSLNDNNNELKKQIDDHNAELVKGKRELEEMIDINRNMVSTIRLLEEESQRNNQRDIQQDRSTQKVLNGKEVREPVNTSQEIINKSSRVPRGKDSVESKKILIIGDETARGCASKLKTSCLGDFNIFLHQFEDALNTLSEHYEKIIIMGDFNVNFIDFTIFEPTRLGSSPSCIDNILTNISQPYSSKVIECCLSDHLAQIIQIETKENIKCGTEIRWTRKINQKLLNKFSKHLELADWSIFNRCSDIESLSPFVVDTYATFIRKTFPLEKISEKRPPVRWSNNNKLREMKDTLCAIKDIYNITKNPTDKRHYEAYRQLYKKSITDTRKQCYEKFIANSDNKSKSSWRIVNYETNRNNRQRETQLPPDTLNTYFTTIACEIISSLPPKNDEFSEYLNHAPKPNVTFFLEPVTELDVINAINRLSNSDSLDAYGINSKIVKQTLHICLAHFAY
nr:unnamed protein product [Callosobruchus analis]